MLETRFFIACAFLVCLGHAVLLRKDVEHLTSQDIFNLQKALKDVVDDPSPKGYAAIASYHGYPPQCKMGNKDVACCFHGGFSFLTWHRLLVVQLEQALKEKGLSVGIPYWDWTEELDHLPELVRDSVVPDSSGGKTLKNPWYEGEIHKGDKVYHTSRAVDDRLFQHVEPGLYTDLFEHVLHAFEYTEYCQFSIQFEIAHNTIHSLVGGRNTISMSSLEYTVYDPIFFLHHSNVDRLLTLFQLVQKQRGIRMGHDEGGICDVKGLFAPLEPFSRDSNPFPLTKEKNSPSKATDHNAFGYSYENLTLNGLDPEHIVQLIHDRQLRDRAFADFRLHNIGASADVRVKVCEGFADHPEEDDESHSFHDIEEHCEHAGDFFILGGPLEMPWAFTRPYHFEITDTVHKLGVPLDGNYHVQVDIFHINGTQLPSDVLPHASVSFRPAPGHDDPRIAHNEEDHEHVFHEGISMRKNADRLTREEIYELREALEKFESDHSVDGFQAIAEFHGAPGKCPHPTATKKFACCTHGMPTFAHWHREIVVQVEDALRRRGSPLGMPYWDWTRPNTHIPALADEEKFIDPHTGKERHNAFHDAEISFLGVNTTRDVHASLTQTPDWGDHTELFDEFLLALEQDNFCDFAVQFEISHNLIHALVGGNTKYGLSTLSYSGFEPVFYLHHSNLDRIWAIWTALQQHRHKPYKAHCAQSYVHMPLKPFAFSSPYNNNDKTFSHSTPVNIYDYEEELGYAFDTLEFGGMTIPELDQYINANLKGKNRVLAGFLLHGIKKSVMATIYIKAPGKEKYAAGRFALLGGPNEMPWRYDRLYQHDITKAMDALDLHWAQPYDVTIEMNELDGTPVDVSQFGNIEITYMPGKVSQVTDSDLHVRKNLKQLTAEEVLDLRHAMTFLEEDKSINGYQTLGRYHGASKWCPHPTAEQKFACCAHGVVTFLHWHRMLVVQAENALRKHGYHGAVPYWDWTQPLKALPEIVVPEKYKDPSNGQQVTNPFFSAHIDDANHDTVRSVRPDLFLEPKFGEYTAVAKQVLLALEQDNFCDFTVQFEIAHNFIHALVGGGETYSMASLAFTAYDPLFYFHHSNTDRLWALWQALQKYRGKPYNSANCAVDKVHKKLPPFSLTSDVNPDPVTREHSYAYQVFDYKSSFHYEYDNLEFNGLTVPQLARVLEQNKAEDRVFVGFRLHSIKHSALTKFYICKKPDDCDHLAGEFYILGGDNEMEWAYDRLYKYEITNLLEELHLHYDDPYTIKYEIHDLDGTDLGHPFHNPIVIHEVGTSHIYGQEYRPAVTAASHVRRNLDSLSLGEVESLRSAFLDIQNDHTYEKIASFHGKPGLCTHDGHPVACCGHGTFAFPAWHRLYVEQVEHALLDHGSSVAVPYWDWTTPFSRLPRLIGKASYYNSRQLRFDPNPFFSGKVAGEDAKTTRDPQPQLFNTTYFYDQALFAMEQDHFCDFEIQFEVLHNAIHSWLGGRAKYSMSTVDYTAFDPVFFLHHANTDRLWAIWQELQRFRGLPYNEADCAINQQRKPLKPFGDDSNDDKITKKYSRPADTFDYRNHFHYEYDNLQLNDMSIPKLEYLLKSNKRHGRMFAGFLIRNIGTTADVNVYVCVPVGSHGKTSCEHKAGVFSILGGETEMPYEYDRLYKLEITKTVRELGLRLDSAANFQLKIDIVSVNGTHLDPHILHDPSIIYEPGTDEVEKEDGHVSPYLIRKNIESLSPVEGYYLAKALASLKEDDSADGFQSIASFHALPPLCPSPRASKRYACCSHGRATFLPWHRVYTAQFEDALRRRGSLVGIPYWDWTRITGRLPSMFMFINYTDPHSGEYTQNPFYNSRVEFENADVERDIQEQYLFKPGPHGWDTWLHNQALFALEKEDYCDFAVQLEITHNAIHAWIGGTKKYSMSNMHYTSYDPSFYIHHANVDRLWAVWQALQKHRGHDPHKPNCALELQKEPLKPFSFGPPFNLNKETFEYSTPEDTFAYEEHYHYKYDALEFVGMSIPVLDAYIKERQEHDRVYAGFMLQGVGQSVNIDFDICPSSGTCFPGGYFSLLGGSTEMPWEFDRAYKYEITYPLKEHHVRYDDDYHFEVHVKATDGTVLDSKLVHEPSVIFVPGKHDSHLKRVPVNFIRRDLHSLVDRDIQNLQAALHNLEEDQGKDGWAAIASFHGAPAQCPDPEHPTYACCQHGGPTFAHWHRAYLLQVEHALYRHGGSVAIPYLDWTLPIKGLPSMFTDGEYYDVWTEEVYDNPFARGYVKSENVYTVRDPDPVLFKLDEEGNHSLFFTFVLETLEQTDFCDFSVQLEVMHSTIHFLVGGRQIYSMSSLEYSAYDPIFIMTHAFLDKIWVVWQELQRRRHLPHNRADCAVNSMNVPMKPFSFEGFNLNKFTRDHAVPNTLFDHENLWYAYDNLDIGGYNIEQLEELIHERQSHARVFAGFMFKGIKTSAEIIIKICKGDGNCFSSGQLALLGGPTEMPWAYDRLFKKDITNFLKEAHVKPQDMFDTNLQYHLEIEVKDVEGNAMNVSDVMPPPTIIYDPPHGAAEDISEYSLAGVGVRKEVNHLTAAEIQNLREAMRRVQEDDGPNGFQNIASFHGSPAHCEHDNHTVACCDHGTSGFPLWHRLYVKQWEDALTAHGAHVGIPYWDWTDAFKALPNFVTVEENNPFHHGKIYNGHITTRDPREQLFNDPEFGDKSFFYRQVLLAFEQTDYCDFEVQFEITHNAIHSWVGGHSPYGMSTLDYTAYDPLFILHHSNVDRQFAIWQQLQKYRGLPYNSANCDIQHLHQPMRPFSDEDNVNPSTRANSRPIDAFSYDRFNYQYDDLHFHGMSVSALNDLLEEHKKEDRVFVQFFLHGIETSADIRFELCNEENHCEFAGTFALLGGEIEHPWAFDRMYKYDVTDVFRKLHLRPDSAYHFVDHITAVNGTELDSKLIRPPSVLFVPGVKGHKKLHKKISPPSDKLIRKNLRALTLSETTDLKDALYKLQQDQGPGGFEAIAGFHGAPYRCPHHGKQKYACCMHGMPIFLHWHRIYTVQFEQALKEHGSHVGIPYWDWTAPGEALPSFITDTSTTNPFSSYTISFAGQTTTRSPVENLFSSSTSGGHTLLYNQTLDVLEEEDFCHFEVALELLHNKIHYFIGGNGTYSMATLDYAAFDPVFMIIHSSLDRIWILWQELQKIRRKPFSAIDCGDFSFNKPLHPFDYEGVNTIELTRKNSIPNGLFDYSHLGYEYDSLDIDSHNAERVNKIIKKRHSSTRYYLADALYSMGQSMYCESYVLNDQGEKFQIDTFYALGSPKEMPWSIEYLNKADITDAFHRAGLSADKPVKFRYITYTYDDKLVEDEVDYSIIITKDAFTDYMTLNIPMAPSIYQTPRKIIVPKGTHIRFLPVSEEYNVPIENLVSLTSQTKCLIPPFSFNSYALNVIYALEPGDYFFVPRKLELCNKGKKIYLVVQDH